jgi:hypothetical protein
LGFQVVQGIELLHRIPHPLLELFIQKGRTALCPDTQEQSLFNFFEPSQSAHDVRLFFKLFVELFSYILILAFQFSDQTLLVFNFDLKLCNFFGEMLIIFLSILKISQQQSQLFASLFNFTHHFFFFHHYLVKNSLKIRFR